MNIATPGHFDQIFEYLVQLRCAFKDLKVIILKNQTDDVLDGYIDNNMQPQKCFV